MKKEIKPILKGWKEGILTKTLRSLGGTVLSKGSIVRYKKQKTIGDDRILGEYEWHYLDQSNYNLIRSHELLIEKF
jgi:hypothetical protein